MVNISKNIFSLNIDTLKERPCHGVGSFCRATLKVRLGLMPEIFICLTETFIQAHYVSERFKAVQTQINVDYDKNEMKEIMQTQDLIKIMYSRTFPSIALMLLREMNGGKMVLYFLQFHLTTYLKISIG